MFAALQLLLELAASWWTIGLLASFAALTYHWTTATFGYWRHRGVPYVRPTVPLFGNIASMALGIEHQARMFGRIYNANTRLRVDFK
ncbi:putative cytochrome P450 6a13 [Aphis craccivora]|uniref:Putative cytochrome P450 6a13 n=1 Tax=Aphis craccivora TaxID=307492 RepID=A0A6G0Y3Y3_APHCR|nr:putative cytochrome P450 6a13 [Aphis craccivora]